MSFAACRSGRAVTLLLCWFRPADAHRTLDAAQQRAHRAHDGEAVGVGVDVRNAIGGNAVLARLRRRPARDTGAKWHQVVGCVLRLQERQVRTRRVFPRLDKLLKSKGL